MLKKKQENKSDCVDVFVAEDRKSLICEFRVQTSGTQFTRRASRFKRLI
jgi:hypothetical protein